MKVEQRIGPIKPPELEPHEPIHFWLETAGGNEGVHVVLRASYTEGIPTDIFATDENGTVWTGPSKSVRVGLWFNGKFVWDERFKRKGK